jgi:hypothetical protein
MEFKSLAAVIEPCMMDLTHMSAVEPSELVAELATSDVVIVFWPDGGRAIIKGNYTLDQLSQIESSRDLSVLTLKLANTTQAEFLYAALMLMEHKHDARLWGRIFCMIGEMPELGQTATWCG